MIRSLKLVALAFFACALSACGETEGPAVSEGDRRYGAEQHPQLLAEFGGSYDKEEATYLRQVGAKITLAAGLEDKCTFTLVNSDVVNAFAVPGCYIYVTRGLLSIVNSEGQLASVLAHEVGHIAGNHSERQQRGSLWRSLGVLAIGSITGSQELGKLAGAAANLFDLRYSRTHEYEADDLGLVYLRDAGYDPYAATDMLAALDRHSGFLARARGDQDAKAIPEWAATHPETRNRIARARKAAEETGLKANSLPEFEGRYLDHVDCLLYGDDPVQGFVLGRQFAHPDMGIAFEAPPGFTLTNSPQAVRIDGPDGLRGEFAGGPLPPGGLVSYAEALVARLLGGTPAELGPVRQRIVNGVPAILAEAIVPTPEGAVALSIAAYAAEKGAAYHFIMVSKPASEPASAIGALFRSFRLLAAGEAASLKPRFIRTREIAPGETWSSLAGLMATDRGLETLLTLNGRSAEDPPRPGAPVKLVQLGPS